MLVTVAHLDQVCDRMRPAPMMYILTSALPAECDVLECDERGKGKHGQTTPTSYAEGRQAHRPIIEAIYTLKGYRGEALEFFITDRIKWVLNIITWHAKLKCILRLIIAYFSSASLMDSRARLSINGQQGHVPGVALLSVAATRSKKVFI